MSPKFFNMYQETVAYKVVDFRINKTDFLMQLILLNVLSLFSIFLLAKSYKLISPALKFSLWSKLNITEGAKYKVTS